MRLLILVIGLYLVTGCSQKTSDQHLSAAKDFVAEKRMDSAVVELKNAIQQDPQSAEARFELGKVYLQLRRYEDAEKELNRALELNYSASQIIPLLSKAYQNTGAYSQLSEIDHTQSGLTPEEEVEVGFSKLQSLLQLDKKDQAKALIAELKNIETDSVYKSLVEVYEQLLLEDQQAALQQITTLKSAFPENPDLLKLKGQLHLSANQPEEAAQEYKEFLQIYPDDTQIVFVLAKLLVDTGQVKEAEPYVDQLLEINAENALLNQLKSVISAANDKHQDAQRYAEKAIQSGRSDPVLRLLAGYSAYILKDYQAANRHLSFIASSLPDNHPGLKMLAASQLELGMSGDAGDVLAGLEDVSEQDATLFSKAGYELIRSGNVKQAKEVVERSAEISRSAEDLTRLGVLRLSLNDLAGIVDLEKALEQSPDLEVTKATLANAYLATNQLDKAEKLAMEWQQSDPEDFKAYMLSGEVFAKRQEYDAAVGEFNKAKALEPDNGLVQLALTNIDFLKGDLEKGEQGLMEILKKKSDFVPAIASYYMVKKNQDKGAQGMEPALEALKAKPESEQLITLVSRMYLSEREFENAISTVSRLPENENTPSVYWSVKGKALLGLNQIKDAAEHFDKWLEIAPNSKEGNVGKLLLLDAEGKFNEGAQLSETFLANRDDLAVGIMQVHFLVMSGQYDKAQTLYDALPEETKDLPVAQGFKARLLLADNKQEDALPLSTQVYENIPNSRNLVLLVSNLEQVGKEQAAFSLLQGHAEKFPNDVAAKMMLAERQIGQSEQDAIATYEASLKLNPDNFVVLNNLAYLYTQEGRLKEAEDYARKAVAQRPENADAVDTLAQVLVKRQNYSEALRFYDRVIKNDMNNEEIYLNYVEAVALSGNTSLARRKLRERQLKEPDSLQRISELKEQFNI